MFPATVTTRQFAALYTTVINTIDASCRAYVAVLDGQVVACEFHHHVDEREGWPVLVEQFQKVWGAHSEGAAVTVFCTCSTVRDLLRETQEYWPGLTVATVASGQLAEQVTAAQAQARTALPSSGEIDSKVPHLVIATDGSIGRGCGKKTAGIAAAASNGVMRTKIVEAYNITQAEFEAVSMALSNWNNGMLRRWAAVQPRVDILTDSQTVFRVLNGQQQGSGSPAETKCLTQLEQRRAQGAEITVHWVRGHNGHVLNELADRAAVLTRRCHSWDMPDAQGPIMQRLEAELTEQTNAVANRAEAFLPSEQETNWKAGVGVAA